MQEASTFFHFIYFFLKIICPIILMLDSKLYSMNLKGYSCCTLELLRSKKKDFFHASDIIYSSKVSVQDNSYKESFGTHCQSVTINISFFSTISVVLE